MTTILPFCALGALAAYTGRARHQAEGPPLSGLVLDAGALIALDRNDRRVVVLLARAVAHELALIVPAGVVGRVWRDGRRQSRLARFLATRDVSIVSLDDRGAREAGQLCGVSRTADVIDATVVLIARRGKHKIVTSDVEDVRRLDPKIEVIPV